MGRATAQGNKDASEAKADPRWAMIAADPPRAAKVALLKMTWADLLAVTRTAVPGKWAPAAADLVADRRLWTQSSKKS